ncbi:hypothetical protein H0A73_00065 [Alcaligenaceae bacterium]|nr:hypothetical protein [Alcaligenaceae bacterium]
MAINSVNTYSRLSDSLERELVQAANSNGQSYSGIEGLGMVFGYIGRAASAFGRYLILVAEAVHEARLRDGRHTRFLC